MNHVPLCPTIDNSLVSRFLDEVLLKSRLTSSGISKKAHLIPETCKTLTWESTRNPGILWTECIHVVLQSTMPICLIGPVLDGDTDAYGDCSACFNQLWWSRSCCANSALLAGRVIWTLSSVMVTSTPRLVKSCWRVEGTSPTIKWACTPMPSMGTFWFLGSRTRLAIAVDLAYWKRCLVFVSAFRAVFRSVEM